jgi:hypothetical protein
MMPATCRLQALQFGPAVLGPLLGLKAPCMLVLTHIAISRFSSDLGQLTKLTWHVASSA